MDATQIFLTTNYHKRSTDMTHECNPRVIKRYLTHGRSHMIYILTRSTPNFEYCFQVWFSSWGTQVLQWIKEVMSTIHMMISREYVFGWYASVTPINRYMRGVCAHKFTAQTCIILNIFVPAVCRGWVQKKVDVPMRTLWFFCITCIARNGILITTIDRLSCIYIYIHISNAPKCLLNVKPQNICRNMHLASDERIY